MSQPHHVSDGPILDTQLSVRFSSNQRRYLQEQLRLLRTDPNLRHFRWSESDLVRALVNEAMRASRQIVPNAEAHGQPAQQDVPCSDRLGVSAKENQ